MPLLSRSDDEDHDGHHGDHHDDHHDDGHGDDHNDGPVLSRMADSGYF